MTPAEMVGLVGMGADVVASPSLERAREFIRASKAESTLRGYQSDWRALIAERDKLNNAIEAPQVPEQRNPESGRS